MLGYNESPETDIDIEMGNPFFSMFERLATYLTYSIT